MPSPPLHLPPNTSTPTLFALTTSTKQPRQSKDALTYKGTSTKVARNLLHPNQYPNPTAHQCFSLSAIRYHQLLTPPLLPSKCTLARYNPLTNIHDFTTSSTHITAITYLLLLQSSHATQNVPRYTRQRKTQSCPIPTLPIFPTPTQCLPSTRCARHTNQQNLCFHPKTQRQTQD